MIESRKTFSQKLNDDPRYILLSIGLGVSLATAVAGYRTRRLVFNNRLSFNKGRESGINVKARQWIAQHFAGFNLMINNAHSEKATIHVYNPAFQALVHDGLFQFLPPSTLAKEQKLIQEVVNKTHINFKALDIVVVDYERVGESKIKLNGQLVLSPLFDTQKAIIFIHPDSLTFNRNESPFLMYHELAHHKYRHSLKYELFTLIAKFTQLSIAIMSGDTFLESATYYGVLGVCLQGLNSALSRYQENQADEQAIAWCNKTQLEAGLNAFKKFKCNYYGSDSTQNKINTSRSETFKQKLQHFLFGTHPRIDERIERCAKALSKK